MARISNTLLLRTLLVGLVSACQANEASRLPYSEVGTLVAHEQFREAVELAARRAEESPDDPAVLAEHRAASVAFLLEQGRRATFGGDDERAAALFRQALELDPESEQAAMWAKKTRLKIAYNWFLRARDLHLDEQLNAALEAYENAIELDPDMEPAREGASRVLLQLNHRDGLSSQYYDDGVRALHEYWLQVARSRFQYSNKYRPDDERSDRRVSEVQRLLSQERMAVARILEERKLFNAARNEYHVASLLDPDNAEAESERERMRIESRAARKADAAGMMILRGELERARETIAEGLEITVDQKELFEEKLADIDDARVSQKYERALNLERDFRYEQAIVVYDELLAEREWYEDARSRKTTLEEYVAHAASLYEKAAAASTDEERVSLLRQIESFWPEYRDIDDQLRTLDPDGPR